MINLKSKRGDSKMNDIDIFFDEVNNYSDKSDDNLDDMSRLIDERVSDDDPES